MNLTFDWGCLFLYALLFLVASCILEKSSIKVIARLGEKIFEETDSKYNVIAEFVEHMNDDFNTPNAITVLYNVVIL